MPHFTVRGTKLAQEDCGVPICGGLQKHLDMVLGNLPPAQVPSSFSHPVTF